MEQIFLEILEKLSRQSLVRRYRALLQFAKNFLTLNMLTKEQVIGAINKLPQEFSVEQAIDELILLEKIETGLEQSKANEVIPDEQLDKELPEWLR
ncbi:MAG: hypothetical protein AAFY41_15680 [Bacteroidota bacterium]